MKFYVYLLIRPWNNVPCYVGKGKGFRVLDHAVQGSNHPNKHLADVFKRVVGALPFVFLYVGDSEQEAFYWEAFFIRWYGRSDLRLGPLCNKTNGGDGVSGLLHSEQSRAQMSLSHKNSPFVGKTWTGRNHTEESKVRMSVSHTGKTISPEIRVRMSQAQIVRGCSLEEREERRNRRLGKKMSEESKAKLGATKIGNKYFLGRKHTPETLEKMSAGRKAAWARKKANAQQQG